MPRWGQRALLRPRELDRQCRSRVAKIGVKLVRYGRYVRFWLSEVAIPGPLFAEILRLIERAASRRFTAMTCPDPAISDRLVGHECAARAGYGLIAGIGYRIGSSTAESAR